MPEWHTFDDGENCTDMGWEIQDITDQGVYFHIDDFAGLGGGNKGLLVAWSSEYESYFRSTSLTVFEASLVCILRK